MTVRRVAFLCLGAVALSACSNSDSAIPTGDPAQYVGSERRGYKARPQVMVGAHNSAYWVQYAVSDYVRPSEDAVPGRVAVQPRHSGCTFRPVAADEKVANVHVDTGDLFTGIYGFSSAAVAERSKRWIENYRRSGDESGSFMYSRDSGDRLQLIDVVITDTSQPIYLVLQNETSNVLWNIQLAKGVKLAHVAGIGSGSMLGVANLPDDVPAQLMDRATTERCKLMPMRKPEKHWRFVQEAVGNSSMQAMVADNQRQYSAYSTWFNKNFGQGSEVDVVGMNQASHVLVGPLPADSDERVAYRSLDQASVILSNQDYVVPTGKSDYHAKIDSVVLEVVKKAAKGDIRNLRAGY